MKQKWKDAQGETLVEVLASILIGALSVALLFTAVTASISMDKTARETDENYDTALTDADMRTMVVDDTAKVTVENTDPSVTGSAEVPVIFYGGENALSFAVKSSLPSPP